MKEFRKETVTAVLLTVLLPGLMLNTVRLLQPVAEEPSADPPPASDLPTEIGASFVRVLTEDGSVERMELEEYLIGVVLGEMPEEFEMEALKAQAVVARTYTLRMCQNSKHAQADVCVNSDCCQSYRVGESEKIRKAVEATAGQVLTYGGALIEATYFSSSGGRTEDAVAVWGSDVPYLRSTVSPGEPVEPATVTVTAREFCEALGVDPEGPCEGWIGPVTYTNGGGVDTMEIAGKVFTGIELRKMLNLRSTAFFMTAVGDHITITTNGHGHRVGMSQYGAEAMAVEGAGYEEILLHYYQGVCLDIFVDKESGMG